MSMKKRLAMIAVTVGITLLTTFETLHRMRYGHFVGYGLHTDIVLADSAVAKSDTYVAVVRNLSLASFAVEGCRLPDGYAGSGVLYHWDVQRWDPSRHDWSSLHGANNWVAQPLGGSDWGNASSKCGGAIT